MNTGSAAANGNDDFELIAADERRISMLAVRDNFAISLDRDALACQLQRFDQLGNRQDIREASGFAIDGKFNHNFYPGKSFSRIRDSTPKGLAP